MVVRKLERQLGEAIKITGIWAPAVVGGEGSLTLVGLLNNKGLSAKGRNMNGSSGFCAECGSMRESSVTLQVSQFIVTGRRIHFYTMTTGNGKKKKTGNPSDFQGLRGEFLREFYPTYANASLRGKTHHIWTDFFIKYWVKFPWRLHLKQDPDPEDTTDYASAPQTDKEHTGKQQIMASTESKIKSWLGRQASAAGMKGNPWAEWLKRLHAPQGNAPKKLASNQAYMQHTDFKAKVAEMFDERKAGVSAKQLLNVRATVARELLAAEPQAVCTRMREEADAEHAAVIEKHEDALAGLPALEEEDLAEAHAQFSGLVCPLLNGLAAHTGYELSLLVGRPKETAVGKLDIECLRYY
ncbi:hypothetical protein B0H16DRAFT_1839373 [Mycena metata]|uniref:Uncharacterized protein n=1 Tax=Mycena metata TaxID=1033252 RepID=A0AAD7NA55_9AGAR|nr:hypothetical protein B0H16DRAFT_1839373 [Mycena metata]